MGTVINFPTRGKGSNVSTPARPVPAPAPAPAPAAKRRLTVGAKLKLLAVLLLKGVWASVWFAVVCLWPILQFVMGIDLLFQAIRTLAYWNTPNVHAGWTFLLHFAVFSALASFVVVFVPPGFRDKPPMHETRKKAS